MALVVVLTLGVVLLLAGAGLLLWGNARRTRVRSMPRSQTRQARPGTWVKVVGRLRARAPLRTPVTRADCLYYRMSIDERDDHDNENPWREVLSETEYAEGWMLEDESGRIGLEPAKASFVFLEAQEYTPGGFFNGFELPPEELSNYVFSRTGRSSVKDMRMREERLDVGASVVVLGQVALGERGPVLVGGNKMEVFLGTEKEVLDYKGSDLISWVLLAAGVLFCVAGGAWLLEEPEPLPVLEDKPLGPRAPAGASEWPE